MKDLSQYKSIELLPFGDLHWGSAECHTEKIIGYRDWVLEQPNRFVVLMGDLMNCSTKSSKAELYEDLTTPDRAYYELVEVLKPIQDRIIMMIRGNHEEAIFRMSGHDYCAQLAHELGDVPYKIDGGMFAIRMAVGEHTNVFTGYAVHGWGGARTQGAKVNKVDSLTNVADVDIYIIAHDHSQNIHRINSFAPPITNMRWDAPCYMTNHRKIMINTGSFLKYAGYGRRNGYRPQDLGTPKVLLEIKNSEKGYYKDIHAAL